MKKASLFYNYIYYILFGTKNTRISKEMRVDEIKYS